MSDRMRSCLLPVLAVSLVFLAGAVPAAAAAPLSSPGQAITLLVRLVPVIEAAGTRLGIVSPRVPLADDTRGEPVNARTDREEPDPDHLPAPGEAPSRDGGYGGWGDEGSEPWPRS